MSSKWIGDHTQYTAGSVVSLLGAPISYSPTGRKPHDLSRLPTVASLASELGVGGAFDLAVIPEPHSVLLLLLGVAAAAEDSGSGDQHGGDDLEVQG